MSQGQGSYIYRDFEGSSQNRYAHNSLVVMPHFDSNVNLPRFMISTPNNDGSAYNAIKTSFHTSMQEAYEEMMRHYQSSYVWIQPYIRQKSMQASVIRIKVGDRATSDLDEVYQIANKNFISRKDYISQAPRSRA